MHRILEHPRAYYAAILAACIGLLLFGLYLQHSKGLEPCPLCIAQRIIFAAIGTVALLGTLHGLSSRAGRVAYGLAISLLALTGVGVAARHTWIQRFPPPIQECGADFYFLVDTTPLARLLPAMFSGTGDCAQRAWVFLGLSIAEWALVCFLTIALLTLWRTFSVASAARRSPAKSRGR
jgi:disulfide bond formation protein DsbB